MDERARQLSAIAARLLEVPAVELTALNGGANAAVFKVTAGDQTAVLKTYSEIAGDGRDRRRTEWQALQFLSDAGVTAVPRPLATDEASNLSLLTWCAGGPVTVVTDDHIDRAADFIARLADLRARPAAAALSAASEACLSAAALADQITHRHERLRREGVKHADFHRFLSDRLAPEIERALAAAEHAYDSRGWSFTAPLDPPTRSLSPSDFGFHNALLEADGRLTFVDFEYFGWDDPVKIAADVMLHPGMGLSADHGRRFADRLTAVFGEADGPDPDFAARLAILRPLYALRWTLIILNEFLPDRWRRRRNAGVREAHATVLARQLGKAQAMLAKA